MAREQQVGLPAGVDDHETVGEKVRGLFGKIKDRLHRDDVPGTEPAN